MRKIATGIGRPFALALPAAATDASVDVRANIKGVCVIDAVTAIDFGDLEPGTTAVDLDRAGQRQILVHQGARVFRGHVVTATTP